MLPIAPQLVDLLHPSWFVLVKLGFLLLILSLLMGATPAMVAGLLIGTLALGFTHFLLLYGWQIAEQFFIGTVHVAQLMGAPGVDPSGVVSWGWAVSDPIFKSLDAQGVLSYITSPFMHLTFEAGAWAVAGAFLVIAAMEMGFLIMSYVLVGTAPFFLLFAVLPVVNQLAMRWASLVFSCMSGLFVTLFIAMGMQRVGQGMLDTLQSKFLVTGVTLTLNDYLLPLGIGTVLIIAFIWIPLKFAGAMGGVAMDILSGVSKMAFGTMGAASAVMAGSGGGGSSRQTSSGGGRQSQIGAPQGAGGGGFGGGSSGMGKAQQPAKGSSWS